MLLVLTIKNYQYLIYKVCFYFIRLQLLNEPDPDPRSETECLRARPVNPKIKALRKSNLSKSLTSLDVNKEVRGGHARRRSYGSDISDVSQKSSQIVKQEKICNQMLADIRYDKHDKRRGI